MGDELNSLDVWAAVVSKGGFASHCPFCGDADCDGFECQDEGVEAELDDYPEGQPCTCSYCTCCNFTWDGGVCWDCYNGAHQG